MFVLNKNHYHIKVEEILHVGMVLFFHFIMLLEG